MTDEEKLTMLKSMTEETDNDVLSTYLTLAKGVVLSRAYPYTEEDKVPAKYDTVHVEIAAYMLNKRGAEGETAHSENGVSRSYEDGDIPPAAANPSYGGGDSMKLMKRNLKPVHYCLYKGREPLLDDDGNETGEYQVGYESPVELQCSVSPATGYAQVNMFGNLESYDKVLITDDTNCPIDENTLLFVDKEPEFGNDGNPLCDYRVRRVAKSLNSISYAISKVTVS